MQITDEFVSTIAAQACADSGRVAGVMSASPFDCAQRAARLALEHAQKQAEHEAALTAALSVKQEEIAPEGWQPMETAPHDRRILVDASYVYPGDPHPTENYVVCVRGGGEEYPWLSDEGGLHRDAAIGWIEIPPTNAEADDAAPRSALVGEAIKGGGDE